MAAENAEPGRTVADSAASNRDDKTVLDPNLASSPGDDRTVAEPEPSPTSIDEASATVVEHAQRLTDSDGTFIAAESRPIAADLSVAKTLPGDEPAPTKVLIPAHAAPVANVPPDQSRYQLVDNFAQGGLGKIWRARDDRLQREVAFKELLPNALKNAGLTERFLEEAQITGQLEHPGIVPIYDLGWQTNGTPFYAMKLVRGATYSKAIHHCHALPRDGHERRLAFVKLLQQFVAICNALAFAHNRGVIHRDLKPQNVMLGDFGETLVLDWGLAKIIGAAEKPIPIRTGGGREPDTTTDATVSQTALRGSVASNVRSEASQTVMGSVMGTPAYMPPEQALGHLHELDARSDVYSLGAILYEVLTGRQPIEKGKITDMLARVVEGRVPPPRSIDATIPRPLEAIAVKAMSSPKSDRYASALELARDVENHLADEPVSAYPEPWPRRAKRWLRRHRTAATAASAVAGVLIVMWIAWSAVESSRVAGIRQRVQSSIAESQRRLEQDGIHQAQTALAEALGLVQSEPKLAALAIEVNNRLSGLKQLQDRQTAVLRMEVEVEAAYKYDRAAFLIETRQDYQAAAQLLTESVTVLEGTPGLESLRDTHRMKLDEVQRVLDKQKETAETRKRLREFERLVDRARFFGSQFTGDQVVFNARKAKELAVSAWAMYGSPAKPPSHELVSDAEFRNWTNHMIEVALILADAEITLAQQQPVAEQRAALERAFVIVDALLLSELKTGSLMRARLLSALGRQDEADHATERAENLDPATAWEFFLLAEIERRNNQRFAEATVLYQRALDIDSDNFLALYFLGVCNLQRVQAMPTQESDVPADVSGYLNAAVTAFTTCLSQRPNFPWPLLLRGVANASLQQFDQANADFERALKLTDADEVHDAELFRYGIHINRGVVALQRDRFAEAAADFAQAMQLRPDNPDPHINQSEVHRRQKQFDAALVELNTAAKLDKSSAKVLRLRGRIHVLLDDGDAAIEDYSRAAGLEHSCGLAAADQFEIGRIHHRAGRFEAASAAYDQALAADPQHADAMRLRAETLLELNQVPQAIAGFSEFLKRGRPVGDVYRARGLALAKIGNYRAAMDDYTRSLELEPDSPNILTRRGWAYLLQGHQLALQDFDESIRQNPENGDSYNGRGYARVLLGDHAAAVKDADEAVRRGPRAFEIYYNAATIFSQAVAAVGRDKRLDDEARTRLAQQFTSRALDLLRQSADILEPQNRPQFLRTITGDPSLDPIRNTEEFKKLVK